eukprot:TRINITY_DN1622_c0_g1_i1.p2 TRINITY_DN1622_c0_g1~~TRINITY_DN1622_c0_g1_i1.p2  ORF type:complete len:123 (-),score=10.20 TRINITY_DN1622_c0_g1_i1:331-699(-)
MATSLYRPQGNGAAERANRKAPQDTWVTLLHVAIWSRSSTPAGGPRPFGNYDRLRCRHVKEMPQPRIGTPHQFARRASVGGTAACIGHWWESCSQVGVKVVWTWNHQGFPPTTDGSAEGLQC